MALRRLHSRESLHWGHGEVTPYLSALGKSRITLPFGLSWIPDDGSLTVQAGGVQAFPGGSEELARAGWDREEGAS